MDQPLHNLNVVLQNLKKEIALLFNLNCSNLSYNSGVSIKNSTTNAATVKHCTETETPLCQ